MIRTLRWTVAAVAIAAATAWAQAPGGDGFVTPSMEPASNWITLVYALVGTAAICVVGLKDARRTHLD